MAAKKESDFADWEMKIGRQKVIPPAKFQDSRGGLQPRAPSAPSLWPPRAAPTERDHGSQRKVQISGLMQKLI